MILSTNQREGAWRLEFARIFSRPGLIGVVLFVVTLAVYWPVAHYDFINFDDPDYFFSNPHVLSGLKPDNIVWAFTTGHASNWHPLTWLSLMLDAECFGAGPAGPHLTNLFFHALNAVLLFWLLKKLTGADFPSAFVAALFAWHPLHVESVAWISERKDVLSTCFGLLSFLSYHYYTGQNYTRSGRRAGYGLALFCFALSLMAKPMLVTMPFILLLLDWWPLGRLSLSGRGSDWRRLLLEKVPFLALSVLSSVVTFLVQKKGGAMTTLNDFTLPERLENVFVSYARYLGKLVWPNPLANPYPLVKHWDLGVVIFAVVLVIGLSVLAVLSARKYPFIFMGWFWFIGTLVPVIGLVQVGIQSMADRYTYVPLIGIFIIIAWGAAAMSVHGLVPRILTGIVAAIILIACVVQTRVQLGFWKDNETLFHHTLAVTKDNYLAYNNLGTWLSKHGHVPEALDCFQKSLAINPYDTEVLYNCGNAFSKLGDWDAAIINYERSLKIKSDQGDVLGNLGFAFAAKKQYTNAIVCLSEALTLEPDSSEIHNNLASILFIGHEYGPAEEQFRAALRLTPDNPQIYINLGDTLAREQKIPEAAQCYQQALALKPDDVQAKQKLQALMK